MAKTANMRAVLVTAEQMEKLKAIQQKHAEESPVNARPSVNAIVRGLIDQSLRQMGMN